MTLPNDHRINDRQNHRSDSGIEPQRMPEPKMLIAHSPGTPPDVPPLPPDRSPPDIIIMPPKNPPPAQPEDFPPPVPPPPPVEQPEVPLHVASQR